MREAPLPLTLGHDFSDGADGWLLDDPLARPAAWLGRPALMLGGGRPVVAPVEARTPYSLEASVSGGAEECYVGACFHLGDLDNFETIYLAPRSGGKPEAIQYDPVINGSNTWQVFGHADGLAPAPLAPERWHRLRLHVWDAAAQVFVDDKAAALFPLRSGRRAGRVGLWGYLPSYVARFDVHPLPLPAPPPVRPRAALSLGPATQWLVAQYRAESDSLTSPLRATSEHNGTLCLNRLYRADAGAAAYVSCAFNVPPGAGELSLETGYSDHARIWVDDVLVHEGEWRWDPAAGTDGRIRLGRVLVSVDPRPGLRTFVAEVTTLEPGFGWGITARVVADGQPCVAVLPRELKLPRKH